MHSTWGYRRPDDKGHFTCMLTVFHYCVIIEGIFIQQVLLHVSSVCHRIDDMHFSVAFINLVFMNLVVDVFCSSFDIWCIVGSTIRHSALVVSSTRR